MHKEKRKTKILEILVVVIIISSSLFIYCFQPVEIYVFTSSDSNEEVILGLDRGFAGIFSKWKLNADGSQISLVYNNKIMAFGYFVEKNSLEEAENNLAREEANIIREKEKRDGLEYSIYEIENKYYCYGYFDYSDSMGVILWSQAKMGEDEAVALYSRLRGAKGIAHNIGSVLDFLLECLDSLTG